MQNPVVGVDALIDPYVSNSSILDKKVKIWNFLDDVGIVPYGHAVAMFDTPN